VVASIANSIHGIVGTSKLSVLIDTGASTSLVSKQVYLDHPILRSQTIRPGTHDVAKSANGSKISLLGRITLPLIIGDCKISHDVYVADPLTSGIILGVDCLQAYKMLLNFDDNTLTIPGAQPVNLLDRANLIGNFRIAVNETVVLNPRAQTVIQAQVFGNPPDGHEGVIEPVKNLFHRHKVIGGRVFAKPVNDMAPYLLLNPGTESVKLYKGCTLGFYKILS
jgi:predicted aspartyl protease